MIKLLTEQPTPENTVPIDVYNSSSPEAFSLDDDKHVIYGGGTGFRVDVAANDPHHSVTLAPVLRDTDLGMATVYVLQTSLVVWFPRQQHGIELGYPAIVVHALREQTLHLEVVSSALMAVEAPEGTELMPCVQMELTRNTECDYSDPMFAQGQSDVEHIYHAMSTCSALVRDESESENDEGGVSQMWAGLGSDGCADDLDDTVPDGCSGMSVDVGYGSILGKRGGGEEGGKRKRGRVDQ